MSGQNFILLCNAGWLQALVLHDQQPRGRSAVGRAPRGRRVHRLAEGAGRAGHDAPQGYTRVKKSLSIGAVKTALAIPTAHLEHANGTEEQCKAYCTKVETRIAGPWELGDYLPSQGQRSEISKVRRPHCRRQVPRRRRRSRTGHLHKVRPWFRCPQAALSRRKMRPDIEVLVIWGPTGVGKSLGVESLPA